MFEGESMKRVYNFLNNELKLKDDDVIIVGVSGGPDSMALLYILEKIRKNKKLYLVCCHVNHNVRKVSKQEKEFLESYCKEHNIMFESMIIEKYGDDNFHNEARTIRYNYFESMVRKYNANYLMTAHHGDDLMETILMRIVRGSTLRGYSGFSQIVDMDGYKLVRPLIYLTKAEIEEFDKKNNIPYVVDQSNFKDKYTRNRYRMTVLPFLKSEQVDVHEKFLKFSKTLEKYDDFINKQVKKIFNKVYCDGKIDIDLYLEQDDIIREKILYLMLEDIYNDDLMLVNDNHVHLIENLIGSRKKNTYIYLPNNIRITKSYNTLYIKDESKEVNNYEIELIDYAHLPNGKRIEKLSSCDSNGNDICRLSSEDVSLPLYVRTRKYGDKIFLKGTNGHKKVKDIFIDMKIPMKERELWPIVVDSNDQVVWIPGLKKSKFNKQKNEKCDIIYRYY